MHPKRIKTIIFILCLLFLIFLFGKNVKYLPDVLNYFHNSNSCGSSAIKLDQALNIASNSECSSQGTVSSWGAECNGYTGNWRLGFSPKEPHPGCGSACVVNTQTKQAEINWMCTGLRMNK